MLWIFIDGTKQTMSQGNVGIFFVVNGQPIYDLAPLKNGESYGDTVGFGGHYEFWENLVPKNPIEQLFKDHPYDYFPRGRVVYFNQPKRFTVYADPCLKMIDIKNLAAPFELPTYQLARDEHYQCSRCNQEFIDI